MCGDGPGNGSENSTSAALLSGRNITSDTLQLPAFRNDVALAPHIFFAHNAMAWVSARNAYRSCAGTTHVNCDAHHSCLHHASASP